MKKIQIMALISIVICLLIVIPISFAVDNETAVAVDADAENMTLSSESGDVLGDNDYYFDANVENDTGDGSEYRPFKELTASRIYADSIIHLASGEYDFSGSKSIYNVTIIGENVQNTIIKNAKFTVSSSFSLFNVTLISSTINNNKELNASNCIFKDSTSSLYGGAINSNGFMTLKNCTFMNNTAVCGGAIFINEGDSAIIDSVFIDNYAKIFGGAITAINSYLTLDNVTAKKNRAEDSGGFVYSMYCDFESYNSTFEDNFALNGSALFIDQADSVLIGYNVFNNNTLFSIYNFDSKIENNTFSSEDELYESLDLNMFIGGSNYTLYNYPSINITDIPSKYDLRDYGYVTPVKNQGNNGNCWAFAALATLESNILKALGESYNLDFSENNMKNLFGGYGDYGWNLVTNKGGYSYMGYNFLTSWLGPVMEEDDPYLLNSLFSRVFDSVMHVQNVMFINRTSLNETDEIKKIIMTYGAVFSQIQASFSNGKQYYSRGTDADHAISVVGWDDDMEIPKAPGRGAWIIKNSWGNSGPYEGYYYVSYYDTSCLPVGKTGNAFVFILNDTIRYDKNYQYDIQGKSDFFLHNTSTVGYKNIFNATDDEYLTAVSTIFQKNTNYTFSIYVNNEFKLSQSGFSRPGYYTFNLNQLIPLNDGDTFEIVFNITVDGDVGFPISEKVSFNKCLYKANTSFVSYDGINWLDLYDLEWQYPGHTYNSAVACIKAFTRFDIIKTYMELYIENIVDNCCDVLANVYNEWGYIVNSGEVTFNISGTVYTVNISNGVAKLSNVSLINGSNTISAEFTGSGYHGSNASLLINIPKINTTMELSVLNVENPATIQASVHDTDGNPVGIGNVVFNVEGIDYVVDVVEGKATLVHIFKQLGLSNISAVYNGLYGYNPSSGNISIDSPLINTTVNLTFSGNHNPVNITASITDFEGNLVNYGNVTFTVEGVDYTVDVVDGIAVLTHIFENGGNVSAVYNGIYNYYSSQCSSFLNFSFINTRLELEVSSRIHNPVEITAKVYDEDNNPVDMGVVVFRFNDETFNVSVSNGTAKLTKIFKTVGFNNISAEYVKNYIYDSSCNFTDVHISKIDIRLRSIYYVNHVNSVTITVIVSNIIDEYLHLLINDEQYSTKIKDYEVNFTLQNLPIGEYEVKAFLNSYIYQSNELYEHFTVRNYTTSLSVDNSKFYNGLNTFSATLKDANGNPIKNKKITVTVGGNNYTKITNDKGSASFTVDFNQNDKNMHVYYAGDEDYFESSLDVNITVIETIMAQDSTKTYNSDYVFQLLDLDGKFLNNTKVTVKVGSDSYNLKTDENGTVTFNVKLETGKYDMIITNPVTGEVKTQSINVVKRITENKAMTVYYGAGKSYMVKVFDDNGNIAKGVKVTFTIKNKKYTRTTDSNGYASFKITQNPGKYTISAEYKGFKVSNKITVKTTIVTKNVKVKKGKTIKFTAKLLDKNGKIVKNKKIKFKFKAKTYKVKTNKKGKAVLKITKKYKKGKYTITTSYGKLKVKNTIRIK